MPSWIEKANVRFVSDGDVATTHVYLVDDQGKEHEVFPVTKVVWSLDAKEARAKVTITLALAPINVVTPIELVEFIREAAPDA